MSRDILILQGHASVIERSPTDWTLLPISDLKDVSLISEADWLSLVEVPGTGLEFNSIEKAYLASLGCTWDAL